MHDAKLRLTLLGIALLAMQFDHCHGLCSLVNGTEARCHDLSDIKYMDTYDLESLKTSTTKKHLGPTDILRNLYDLRHLGLTRGQLQTIEPETFGHLHELRGLDLSYNNIEHLESSIFDGLKKLRTLSIRKNNFKQIPNGLLNLKHLKVFDIAGNPLNCNCQTLKMRDQLLEQGVHLMKKIVCSSPTTTKGKQLVDLKIDDVCRFEEQDAEMQKDEPDEEKNEEGTTISSDDPFEDDTPTEYDDDYDEEDDKVTVTASGEVNETPIPTKLPENDDSTSSTLEATTVSLSTLTTTEASEEQSTSADQGIFISEDTDKVPTTPAVHETTMESMESFDKESSKSGTVVPVEGSGEEDDLQEGSGIEGSGTGVPPINWSVPHEEEEADGGSTSKGGGFLETLGWGNIGGASASPEDDPTKDLDLQEEEFISASTEPASTSSSKSPTNEEIIVPIVVSTNEGAVSKDVDVIKNESDNHDIGSKSGRVQNEVEGSSEVADASPARQPQKGMGSYVVLGILLFILGTLIGLAAYKGEFCRNKRKSNDVERGTELKDMTKSLLEAGNGAQPKIASNGNLENVPLVFNSPTDGSKGQYTAIPDVIDPVKPSRKSYTPQDDTDKARTNGRSHQDLVNSSGNGPEACPRTRGPVELTHNGNNRHGSLSSVGTDSRGSPSIARTSPPESMPTNGSVGNLHGLAPPPLSPGAQRVKITLQDNPDSVPKTPILITRTKAGDNLVKTP